MALDRALLDVLGVAPEASPLLQACQRNGLAGAASNPLQFPLLTPADLRAAGFVVSPELMPVRFNPLRFGKNSVRRLLIRLEALS